MEDDLSRAAFFDGRTVSFLRKLLNMRNPNPINRMESQMLERAEDIRTLNNDLSRDLIGILQGSQNYVAVPDALLFLLEARKKDALDEAVEVLREVPQQEKHLSKAALAKLLRESQDMPMSWAFSMLGDNGAARHPEKDKKKGSTSVSMDDMRRRMM